MSIVPGGQERDLKASRQQDSRGLVYRGADSRGEELWRVE